MIVAIPHFRGIRMLNKRTRFLLQLQPMGRKYVCPSQDKYFRMTFMRRIIVLALDPRPGIDTRSRVKFAGSQVFNAVKDLAAHLVGRGCGIKS